MSNTQALYLQNNITAKLSQDRDCLRKLVAHKNLHIQLQALADGEQSRSWELSNQTTEERMDLLKVEQYKDRISIGFNTERFADLSLEDI
ncbi:MAG: hypothetical protein M1839_009412 [Geoglossum umbratile]|nr:MAG: hypothetical protein M1839_009412 [Geoglossum umbratile]